VTRAAIYLRISQDREGSMLGIDRQREDCTALCGRLQWDVVEVLVDDDVSAFRRKPRPGYRALLDALRDGKVDAVAAWHPDRLHRSPVELEEFIDVVDGVSAQVATVQAGELDLTSPTGRMTARIVGAVARHESEHKAERIRRQREQAARAGDYHGGRRPFGYQRGGVLVDDTEAALVREAAARVLAGESLRRIADDWNDRGLTSSSGARWQITTLRSMLAGPRLAGLRVHRGEVVGDAVWPAILDRETFEKLALILGDPRRRQGARPPVHLLTGLLRCGFCGEVMHAGRRPDGARRWVCNKKPGRDACGRIAIVGEPLEQLVTEAVLLRIASPAVTKAMRRRPNTEVHDYGVEIARCERELDDLAFMLGAGEIDRRQWLKASAGIKERLRTAQTALARAEGTEALAPLRDVDARSAWDALDIARRRSIIAALVDHIRIGPANGRTAFAEDRVHIEWKA
jgi:DNA invertase Pin-like site-specific DNA recombinase